MRLEDLTPSHVKKAVAVYLDLAWPTPAAPNRFYDPEQLEASTTLEEAFSVFTHTPVSPDGPILARYTLRLGNENYPFMKFVIQEYLVRDEYFFSVDTHDDLDIRESNSDYHAWQELRRQNRELKGRIEDAWRESGLPTHRHLRELAEDLALVERDEKVRGAILVVDDERAIADGLRALLEARGYAIETAYDGLQALERLEREPLPDLVLLDHSMPGLNGQLVLERMRRDPRLEQLPVLLATASEIHLSDLKPISGILRKPYPRAVLFALLENLLEPKGS